MIVNDPLSGKQCTFIGDMQQQQQQASNNRTEEDVTITQSSSLYT